MKRALVIIVLGMILFPGNSFFTKPEPVEEPTEVGLQQIGGESISLVLVGDIMLDRGVDYMTEKYGDGDFKFPFLKIADYLNEADIVFGNLEGPISDKGAKVGSIYSFRAEPKAIEGLTYSGFNILSLANNHAFDYGREALEDTVLRLKEAGIGAVGLGLPLIQEIKGAKIGFLSYTNTGLASWGISWTDENNLEKIKKEIEETKRTVDILIVSLHAGEEYQPEPGKFQVDFAEMAIDAGADVAVGHHPHVVQKREKRNDGFIFYSLGNFVFDQGFSEETMRGEIVKILIENDKIKEVIPEEIKINEFFQPEIGS